ncbi:MAG: type II toxin-antitoxin system VapC family toxin [Anaerolineae bacterium]
MAVASLLTALSPHRLAFLDTNVFSYHLCDHPRYAPLSAAILGAVESGALPALATTLTLAELLTLPAKAGDAQALTDYELFLTCFPNLRLVPLDEKVAREAAFVRASTGLRTPDAIQVASARVHKADVILSNDRKWSNCISYPQVLLLEAYACPG